MRFPAAVHVTTCLPCGFREPVRPGAAYAPRCPNCGGPLEHYDTTVDSREEWRAIRQEGSRGYIVQRPRLVVGVPA